MNGGQMLLWCSIRKNCIFYPADGAACMTTQRVHKCVSCLSYFSRPTDRSTIYHFSLSELTLANANVTFSRRLALKGITSKPALLVENPNTGHWSRVKKPSFGVLQRIHFEVSKNAIILLPIVVVVVEHAPL